MELCGGEQGVHNGHDTGKNNRRKRALLLCKCPIIFICTDLHSVSHLLSSSLEGEEAEDKESL